MDERIKRRNGRPGRSGKAVNSGVYLSADLHKRLTEKAKEEKVSACEIIRLSLENSLAASAAPQPED
jgi:hypothetical protein